jgi:serine/threonine protein kinase
VDTLSTDDPHQIGPYHLIGRLGAGGMGRVYLARSEGGRTVAVKLVQSELAQEEEFRQRFAQEVAAARRVGGEWTAPVLEADTEADTPWVATAYIPGPSLQGVVDVEYGPLPAASVQVLANGLAHALKAVHGAGLIHRDLKPSNILLTIDGPRVIDFGIARALETATDSFRTRTGAVIGSPGFMSPEQVRGLQVTPASDVFCMGAVLAYAATGRPPFGTMNSGLHAVMFRVAEEAPDLYGLPEGPDGIGALVRECLAKLPGDRPTPDELIARTRENTVDPWLPGELLALLGRQAADLLDYESPTQPEPHAGAGSASDTPPPSGHPQPVTAHDVVLVRGPEPGLFVDPTQIPPVRFLTARPSTRRRAALVVVTVAVAAVAVTGALVFLPERGAPGGGAAPAPTDNAGSGTGPGGVERPTPVTFAGEWEGPVKNSTDRASETFARLVITDAHVGQKAADFLFVDAKMMCQGTSTLVSRTVDTLVLSPGTTTSNVPPGAPQGTCAPPAQQIIGAGSSTGGDIGGGSAGGTRGDDVPTLNWRAGELSATLRPAVTGKVPVSEAYLGTWRLADTRDGGDQTRVVIKQGPVGTRVARSTSVLGGSRCASESVLVMVSDKSLLLGPNQWVGSAATNPACHTPMYTHTYTRTDEGLRVTYPASTGADPVDLVRVD